MYSKELTAVAATVGCALAGVAHDEGSVVNVRAVVRAHVGRAERLAALRHLAGIVVTLHLLGVVDRKIAGVRTGDGVAIQRWYFVHCVSFRAE